MARYETNAITAQEQHHLRNVLGPRNPTPGMFGRPALVWRMVLEALARGFEERAVAIARVDAIDVDLVWRILDGGGARHVGHGAFGRTVGAHARVANQAVDGRDVDDGAAVAVGVNWLLTPVSITDYIADSTRPPRHHRATLAPG